MSSENVANKSVLFVGYTDVVGDVERALAATPRWSPAFARDATDAWSMLAAQSVSTVVLNPGLGVGLSADVRRSFPRVAQLCWASAGAPATSERSGDTSSSSLPELLERLDALRSSTMNEAVLRVARNLGALPAVPASYWNIARVAARPTSSAADIAAIVQTDPALTARVLQLANSTIFGRASRIRSIAHAVSYLGVELLRSLVVTAHAFSSLDVQRAKGFSLDRFQLYSIRVARLAQRFAGNKELGEECFTAGILHDLGEIVLAVQRPEEFSEVLQRVARTGEARCAVEEEVIGVRHEDIAAFVLDTWGIPISILECVAFHHRPREARCDARAPLPYVHAADALCGIHAWGEPPDSLDVDYLERCGLADRIDAWRLLVEEELQRG